MAIDYSLIATACPALVVSAALHDPAAAVPVQRRYYSQEPAVNATLTDYLKRNNIINEDNARYGTGAYAVAEGLELVDAGGLLVDITAGAAQLDGTIVKPSLTEDLALSPSVRNYVWIGMDGTIVNQPGTTAAPSDAAAFLGSWLTTGAGKSGNADYSGRYTLSGGGLYRRTADASTPSDTPSARVVFFSRSLDGLWLWTGAEWLRVGPAPSAPVWVKVNKTYADLAAAATSNDIEVYSLPAGAVIHAVKIKHSTAFTGGAISAYTLSVGIVGNLTKYAGAFSVFGAPSNTSFQLTSTVGSENHGAVTSIRLAAVSTGANLSAATAGVVDVWLLVSIAV